MAKKSPRPAPGPAESCVVQVTTRGGPFAGVDPRSMRLRAQKMLAALGIEDAELSIALVDDPCIRELNRSFRDIDRPTDVLAFPMAEGGERGERGARDPVVVPAGLPNLLGDVVISVPTAGRQARRLGRRLLDELTTLLAHGLLHLLGLDHATRADERAMKERTVELEEAAQRPRRQVSGPSGPGGPGKTARGSRRR